MSWDNQQIIVMHMNDGALRIAGYYSPTAGVPIMIRPISMNQQPRSVRIPVKAVPGASCDQIVGMLGGRLKIRVSAAPEGGKANAAICALVAAAVGVKPRQVRVLSGHGGAEKVLEVLGMEPGEVARRLGL